MSKSAGTLITTYDSTYVPPRFMPGYQGHVPGLKFSVGDTYGGATCKSLQDTRLATLSNSKTTFANGGTFPSFYTHKPELVLDARTRSRDRFLYHPHYTLYNTDRDRLKEIKTFDGLIQAEREHYKDRSLTLPPVNHFILPRDYQS